MVAFEHSKIGEGFGSSAGMFECLVPSPSWTILEDEGDIVGLHLGPSFEEMT